MSDIKGIEVHDILGLSQPLTKLIETVSCGIGTFYEPFHKKRMAKANAKEIEIISEVVNDNISLPISYEAGQISIDAKNANDLVIRAQNRFLFQQMKKQQNIDNVVANAYAELVDKPTVSDEPVDSDWISSFFDFIANISEEQMQLLWGKLLAGEVERPGSFSIRTMDVLRKLTQKEASTFRKIAPYILTSKSDTEGAPDDYFILSGDTLNDYGITFPDIMILDDAQIMSESNSIWICLKVKPGKNELISNSAGKIKFINRSQADIEINHRAHLLTTAGRELISIVLSSNSLIEIPPRAYLEKCKDEFLKGDFALVGDNTQKEKGLYTEIIPL